jgi:hypothetical protein
LSFAIGMVTGLGIKTPFDYSVFSAAAAAFLLAFWEPDRFTLDKLLNRLRNRAGDPITNNTNLDSVNAPRNRHREFRSPSSPKAAPAVSKATVKAGIIMSDQQCRFARPTLMRLQNWLSPAFPTGSCSYSRVLEWTARRFDSQFDLCRSQHADCMNAPRA